jgi:hypothetical protein
MRFVAMTAINSGSSLLSVAASTATDTFDNGSQFVTDANAGSVPTPYIRRCRTLTKKWSRVMKNHGHIRS